MMPTLAQWVHVTAAVVVVGGIVFLLFVLTPSLEALQPEQRDLLAKRAMDRFLWVIWPAIVASLVSGFYALRQYYWEVAWGKSWMLLTVKIVLAFFVFLIALALTLPFKALDQIRARQKIWLSVAVGLGVAVILLSAYLRR